LPAETRALSKWTSLAARGTTVGITHAAGRLGAGTSAPMVAFLISWFSCRFSFVALGIVSAGWAVMWWWYFHEDPRRDPGITSAELAALPSENDTDEAALAELLRQVIAADRYPLSPRITKLRAILDKLEPQQRRPQPDTEAGRR
jgi:sugar phosphate permease